MVSVHLVRPLYSKPFVTIRDPELVLPIVGEELLDELGLFFTMTVLSILELGLFFTMTFYLY